MVGDTQLESITGRMLEIVESIRATNPDRHHLMRNYWISGHEYPSQAAAIDEIAKAVRDRNPRMLNEDEVRHTLIPIMLQEVVAEAVDEDRFRGEAHRALAWLSNYDVTQELDVQLVNLIVRTSFQFGPVEILPIPNTGDLTEYKLKYEGPLEYGGPVEAVNSYAAVRNAPGLGGQAWTNAIDTIERVLTVVRGIGLPHLWGRKWAEMGVAGRGFASGWAVLRRGVGQWDMAIGGSGPHTPYMRLEHMLQNYPAEEIRAVETIFTSQNHSEMERKVLQALFWMGEATSPASSVSKYVRLAVAFESAVGGESSKLTEIGTTEMLAERTAFLLGHDRDSRLSWHKAVKKLYGIRSRIMHGELESVGDDDLKHWAFLVWKTARAVLNRTSEFGTVDQFAKWVRNQRYT